jgi:hypothetical protein
MERPIEIPLDKSKITLMLIGALAFVAIGFWFIIAPPTIENSFWGNPVRLTIAGYGAIVFFGLCAVIFFRKLTESKPGLIIDDAGLIDHSGGLSAGKVLWSDIDNISVFEFRKQKLLMLEVKNPQEYINRQTNVLKRKGMQMNYKMYGTPLSISTNALKISFQELIPLIQRRFQESRIE